jgi:predicted permease
MRRLRRLLDQFKMRVRMFFGRSAAGSQLDDELQFHLDRQIAENLSAGMPPGQARRAALRAFGNPALLRDQTRATWSWNWLESLARDLRFALRALCRNPGFTATIIGTMAVGIGASAAMFTVVDHVLLRPLPYRDAGRLVVLEETNGSPETWPTPWRDIEQWQAQSHSFSDIAFSSGLTGRNYLEGASAAQEVQAERVSSNLFTLLGVQPVLGHGFFPAIPSFAADKNAGSIVLSDTLWREVFNANPNIIGRTVKINNVSYTVAGVMPASFRYPVGTLNVPQAWIPIELSSDDKGRDFKAMQYTVLGRLRDGVSLTIAAAEIALIQNRNAAQYADEILRHDHTHVRLQRYADSLVKGGVQKALLALLAASGVLWLIASLNVTNLLLARNMARQREIATRIALGASRRHVALQMFVEGFLLNGVAALMGIGLAVGSVKFLAHELSQSLPVLAPALPDQWILLALLSLTILSTLISTAWPAYLAVRTPVEPALRQGGLQAGTSKRQHRIRGVLVGIEIALSLTLLVTCGLLLRSIYALRQIPLGFRTDHIIVANLSIPSFRYENRNMTRVLYEPLLDRVQHLHGVQSTGLISSVPLGHHFLVHLEINMNANPIVAFMKAVTPDIQKVLGFKMAAGRYFNADDTAGSQPVLVVNETFARRYAPNQHDPHSVVGLRLLDLKKNASMVIIGVLADEHQNNIADPAQPEVEVAIPQMDPSTNYYGVLEGIGMDLAVRTDRPASQVIPELRSALRQASPELQNATITTMDQVVEDSYGSQRLAAHLLEIFGGSALVLCVAGLYGLLAYVVSQRTRELGVRIALGASRSTLLWMVMRQAGTLLLAGVAVGTSLAFASGKLVSRFLYGVSAHDAWTIAAAAILLLTCGLSAAYIPSRRAANTDPMQALRTE